MKTIIHVIQPFVLTLLALTSFVASTPAQEVSIPDPALFSPWQPVCRLVPGAGRPSSASLVVDTQNAEKPDGRHPMFRRWFFSPINNRPVVRNNSESRRSYPA